MDKPVDGLEISENGRLMRGPEVITMGSRGIDCFLGNFNDLSDLRRRNLKIQMNAVQFYGSHHGSEYIVSTEKLLIEK